MADRKPASIAGRPVGRQARARSRAMKPRLRKRVEQFASRAFRRPADEAEVDRIMQVIATQTSRRDDRQLEAYADGLKTVLCSPNFLYLEETDGRSCRPSPWRRDSRTSSGRRCRIRRADSFGSRRSTAAAGRVAAAGRADVGRSQVGLVGRRFSGKLAGTARIGSDATRPQTISRISITTISTGRCVVRPFSSRDM